MSNQAPVCLVNPPTPKFPTKGAQFVSVPVATDLASAIAAVNAMRQNWAIVQTQVGQNNTVTNPATNPGGGAGGSSSKKSNTDKKSSNFIEVSRKTTKTKITDPNDPSVFVEVEQITGLTLKQKSTGETWTWTQGNG